MISESLGAKYHEAIRRQRRDAIDASKAFEAACRSGDVEHFREAVKWLHDTCGGWKRAMMRATKLDAVADDIRAAFLIVWIESKYIRQEVGNRRILADALRRLLPRAAAGAPTVLYRGASWMERVRRIYGISWTSRLDIARRFAEQWTQPGVVTYGGVILKTAAPAEAILLTREDENYFDEGEVIVDPFFLGNVEVVERLR